MLDTTGSMSGLIEGAKEKIWSIANEMIAAKPTPELEFALIGYRDRGDDYVTKLTDLTGDIDTIRSPARPSSCRRLGHTEDAEIAALNREIGGTLICYGDAVTRRGGGQAVQAKGDPGQARHAARRVGRRRLV